MVVPNSFSRYVLLYTLTLFTDLNTCYSFIYNSLLPLEDETNFSHAAKIAQCKLVLAVIVIYSTIAKDCDIFSTTIQLLPNESWSKHTVLQRFMRC